MATLEQLPADQRAVLSLLLSQQKSYAQIAESLELSEADVSERAYRALDELARPEKSPSARRRSELGDYLLGQQSNEAAAKTQQSLGRSPNDRAWLRAAAAPLAALPAVRLPVIPGADAAPDGALLVTGDATPPPRTVGGLRSGVIVIALAALAVAVTAGVLIGRASGGDGSGANTTAATTATNVSTTATPIARAALKAPAGAAAPKAVGVAEISQQADSRVLSVVAKAMPAAPSGSQYGVWLTADAKPAVWLGYFQAIAKSGGGIALQGTLNGDPNLYSGVLVSLESDKGTPTSPGKSYLVGPLRFSAAS